MWSGRAVEPAWGLNRLCRCAEKKLSKLQDKHGQCGKKCANLNYISPNTRKKLDPSPSPFPMAQQPLVGQGRIMEISRPYSETPHSVGLLWTSDWSDVETPTLQNTTLTRHIHSCLWWDSNTQSQQAMAHKPTPYTARPLGSTKTLEYITV